MNNLNLRTPSTWEQIKILTAKNLLLFTRKKSLVIFHVAIVVFIFCFTSYTNFLLVDQSVMYTTEKYQPYDIPQFKKCQVDNKDCTTLGVIYFSDYVDDPLAPWIENAMASIRSSLNLINDVDVRTMYKGNNLTEIGNSFDSFKEIKSVLMFCNKHNFMTNGSTSLSCEGVKAMGFVNLELNVYGLIYNQSAIAPNLLKDPNTPMSIDVNAVILKKVIDQSIIELNRKGLVDQENAKFELDVKLASFPKPKLPVFDKFDSITIWSSFHYMFFILISFTQFTKLISQEKQNNLRKGLEPYGLSAFAYWASWVIFALIFNAFFTLLIAGVGFLFNAITFVVIPAYLTMFLIFSTLMAYSFIAIMITTICNDYRSASKVAYTIFIISLFLQIFFSQNVFSSLFFFVGRPTVVIIAQWVLSIIPSFPFTIICNSMHFQAGYHLDIMTLNYVKGDGYNLTTFFEHSHHDMPLIATIDRPADVYFQVMILVLIIIYILLIYVFDHKIESNRGYKAKFFRAKIKNHSPSVSRLGESLFESEKETLFEIKDLTKIFRSVFKKSDNLKALNKVNLTIRKNETMALLGENGAGKSTMISILCGVIDYTKGQIFFNGKPYNPQDHQKLLISVCPQYDLLWEELTVHENLYMIGQFKGMTPQQIKKDIKEILLNLNLKSQKDTLVRMLSGGMKRRASVGMALLGNSELVIFDEPTTGLDPINRKAVWEFIQLLKKKGKTILITTHIMDEADYLSDRIAIINKGKILKVDRSIDIKNQFKSVNIIFSLKAFSNEFIQELKEYFEVNFPGVHALKYQSEKRIKFSVENRIENLKKLVKDFETNIEDSTESRFFDSYIDSFEIAVLDLEEAYILVNEESEQQSALPKL